ncbi:unnamed protein product [Schistosoma rodhaini]|uniref:Apical junction molecule ajm1 alpha/beta domain-containing protein n=1 Tax=Schistosoma rodhaini TaxID=6188 RepID=A0AA85F5F6_9TREM|nr:unnamed protein product [Schistosoma rodhaini]
MDKELIKSNSQVNKNTNNEMNNNTITTIATNSESSKYSGRNLALADEWIQATEARYDSMENLLQSVRHDIDVLTERLNQTTPTSPELIRSTTTVKIGNKQTNIEGENSSSRLEQIKLSSPPLQIETSQSSLVSHEKDLSDNLKCIPEKELLGLIADKDEFMDIRIRPIKNRFPNTNADELFDCNNIRQFNDNRNDMIHHNNATNTTDNNERSIEEDKYLTKTWRSPSDFNLHDPFYGNSYGFTDEPYDNDNINDAYQLRTMHYVKIRQMDSSHKINDDINNDDDDDDEVIEYNFPSHDHHSMIETDLDDYQPDKQENSTTESENSLSPAISPTFGNLASDEIKLQNMIISNNDTIILSIGNKYLTENNNDVNSRNLNSEDFKVYDNGHSLTTIDEASEENDDDDWSSYEHEISTNNGNNNIGNNTTEKSMEEDIKILKPFEHYKDDQIPINQSVSQEFKLSCIDNNNSDKQEHIIRQNENVDESALEHQQQQVEMIKDNIDNNTSKTNSFVYNEKCIITSEYSQQSPNIVLLRPKKIDNSCITTKNLKSRPVSAEIRNNNINNNNKKLEKSHSGSLSSMLSTISQEGVISEADSYVTVCSHLIGTGSEEAYTTAQSDSDAFNEQTLYTNSHTDEENDYQTLSCKKVKTLSCRSQKRKCTTDPDLNSQSASDLENDNETILDSTLTTSTPVTVTPKFTKLPSKLIASSENAIELKQNDIEPFDEKTYVMDTNYNANLCDMHKYEELSINVKDESNESEVNDNKKISTASYKRVTLKRPNRSNNNLTDIFSDKSHYSDSDNESSDSISNSSSPSSFTSSSSSDDLNEAHYDTSQPESWIGTNFKQLNGVILPDMMHRPNYHTTTHESKKKRLSKIIETSQSSLNDDDNNNNGDQQAISSSSVDEHYKLTPSLSSLQRDEVSFILPNVSSINTPTLSNNIFNSDTFKPEVINRNTRALTQSNNSLVENYGPVTPVVQYTDDNDKNILVGNQQNQQFSINQYRKKENANLKSELNTINLQSKNNNNEYEKLNHSDKHVYSKKKDHLVENTKIIKPLEIITTCKEDKSSRKEVVENHSEIMYDNNMRLPQTSSSSSMSSTYVRKEHFFPKHLNTNDRQISNEEKRAYKQNEHIPIIQSSNSPQIYASNLYENNLTNSKYTDEIIQPNFHTSYSNEHHDRIIYEQNHDNQSYRSTNGLINIKDETKISKPYEYHTENFYDNELDDYNRINKTSSYVKNQSVIGSTSSTILAKSPYIIEDRSRYTDNNNNIPSLQENKTLTNVVSFETVKQPTSLHYYEPIKAEQDDIQLASQRKSRILQGDCGDLDNQVHSSIKYKPGPILSEKEFIDNQIITNSGVSESCRQNTPEVREINEDRNYKPIQNYASYRSVTIKDETHKPVIKSNELINDLNEKNKHLPLTSNYNAGLYIKSEELRKVNEPKESVELSNTPILKGDLNHRHRQMSPSPPRHHHILSPSTVTSKPPTHYHPRTKWHLKPIPTDDEIRERLRSSSRKRQEERQSRSVQNPQPSPYRPRSSRSDSRYRFTDLDSAIAESRADTIEATNQLNTDSESHSEARQSASLFDLDAQIQKARTPTTPSYQYSSGVYNIQNEPNKLLTKKFFGDTKSYSSLLETDIDTGENFKRPVILETDLDKLNTQVNDGSFDAAIIDTYQDRTRSLYNLTFTRTPGAFRRQKSNEFGGNTVETGEIELLQSPTDQWQKAKSYQGLVNSEESDLQKVPPQYEVARYKKKTTTGGAQGLIDRLKEKARSTHELRIAQSLTKLHIPEWLDKANCLQTTSDLITTNTVKEYNINEKRTQFEHATQKHFPSPSYTPRTNKALISSLRSLSSICKPSDNSLTNISNLSQKTIETVAEPIWPKSDILNPPNFVRPSQLIKQKSGQTNNYLRPIQSKLNNSMRSLSAQRYKSIESQDIRPQVAPRHNYTKGQGKLIELNPQDFIPKYEQRWCKEKLNRFNRATTEPPDKYDANKSVLYLDNNSKLDINQSNSVKKINLISSPNIITHKFNTDSKPTISLSNIKDVDHDSGTENSNEHQMISSEEDQKQSDRKYENVTTTNVLVKPKEYLNQSNLESKQFIQKNASSIENCLSLDDSESKESSQMINPPDKISYNELYSADADGETESEVTDGFDQLSDLTCLTSLLDTCSSRHRSLLANRPSALEHLLISVGWWPVYPEAEHRYLPPTAAEAISIAAHEFDIKEDSHRYEYLQLIAGPDSHKPLNLGEFGLNQLSGAMIRHPIDGLLYISCGKSTCSTKPLPVSQANKWCACANCFTLYCSNKCREECESNPSDHPSNCSFSRAKRVCCRLLRNLAPGQITGLTALAKTGMARLGRGGILLSFSLIKHAETFLQRSLEHSFVNEELDDTSIEKALRQWERLHQPSPGGLMAPPTYLTLNELEELDSSVANPCKSYNPSSSMVLIVVVCAYELIARKDGRPVHLFKQSLILPFPSHSNLRNKNEVAASQNTQPTEKPEVSHMKVATMKIDKQAIVAREAYMLRLQRMLRERGVSLRHHYPEIYTRIANFVETGIPFSSIRITFDDFLLQQQVNCIIQPMKDLYIEPVNNSNNNTNHSNQYLKETETNKSSTNIQSKYVKNYKSHEMASLNRKKLTETNF